MKKPDQMTKAELVQRVKMLERPAPASHIAFEQERLLHELQVHQVELETQNRDLREAQLLIETSRDRYADLYDFAPVGYVTLDDRGVILEINLTAAGMLDADRSRLVGVPFHLYVARQDLAQLREHLRRHESPEAPVATELSLVRKGGGALAVMMKSVLVYDAEKKTYLCRAALTDITELKQAEQAVRESAEMKQSIISSLSAHIAVLDNAGNIIAVNESWSHFARENGDSTLALTGVGTNYLDVCLNATGLSRAEAQRALEGIQSVLKGALPQFGMEYACDSPAEKRWFQMLVTPLSAGDRGAVISHMDISQRRFAASAVSEKEARLRAVLDTAVDGIITIDERGTVESFNHAAEKLFGYPASEAIGQNVNMLMPSPHREQHDRYLENYRGTGERKIIGIGREVSGRRKDSSTFPLELSVSEVHLADRRIFTGIVRDISRRKQAEESLREERDFVAAVLDIAGGLVIVLDNAGRIVRFNRACERLSGYESGEVLGKPIWDFLLSPEELAAVQKVFRKLQVDQMPSHHENHWLTKAGERRFIAWSNTALKMGDGTVKHIIGTGVDITERKREELRRTVLYETSRVLATAGSLAEAAPQILQTLAKTLHWDVGEFWEAQGEPKVLRMVHVWSSPGRKLAVFVKQSLKLSFSMCDGLPAMVLSSQQPQWIQEISQCPHFDRKSEASQAGLRSAAAFPIRLHGQPLGVMAFLTLNPTAPDQDLLQLFAALGNQIGQFMERKKAEEALREANEFGQQVMNGAQAGIVVCDREGRFSVWNSFMERLTGYRAAEVLGRNALEVFPFLREQDFGKLFKRALAGEIFETADLPFNLRRKGKKAWVVGRFAPCRNAENEIVGVIVAIRDITERRRLEAELLNISDREQRRIGHDLHDGLGQQLTGLEMKSFRLMEDLAGEDFAALRKELQELASQMNRALRECITVTRSLAHGLAPVVFRNEGLTGALQRLAQDTSLPGKVVCRFISTVPVALNNDQAAGHLYRIAQEAVNNALKHARTRRITIHLGREEGLLRLQIKDDGRGLPKMRKARAGMGLDVMRHRAHVIGAALEIESKPGRGVSVTCTLPMEET